MNTQPVPVSQLLVWRRAIQGLFNQHPFNLLSDLGKRTEPVLVFRVAGEKIYFFNEPDLVKEVLVTCHAKLRKGRGLDRVMPWRLRALRKKALAAVTSRVRLR